MTSSPELKTLRERIRAGIDWGRSGPWPPDAVAALEELDAGIDEALNEAYKQGYCNAVEMWHGAD